MAAWWPSWLECTLPYLTMSPKTLEILNDSKWHDICNWDIYVLLFSSVFSVLPFGTPRKSWGQGWGANARLFHVHLAYNFKDFGKSSVGFTWNKSPPPFPQPKLPTLGVALREREAWAGKVLRCHVRSKCFGLNPYLKNEPLVGFTRNTQETFLWETNGHGTRNGGIIKTQLFSDLPQIGQVSGNFVKKIFHWLEQCCMQRTASSSTPLIIREYSIQLSPICRPIFNFSHHHPPSWKHSVPSDSSVVSEYFRETAEEADVQGRAKFVVKKLDFFR